MVDSLFVFLGCLRERVFVLVGIFFIICFRSSVVRVEFLGRKVGSERIRGFSRV